MRKFEQLLESLDTIKQIKFIRYPKQIRLSEEFKQALTRELNRQQNLIKESNEPVNNFDEKFLKALKFFLHEKNQSKKTPSQHELMKSIRKPMPPPTSAHKTFKGKGSYNRQDKSWRNE